MGWWSGYAKIRCGRATVDDIEFVGRDMDMVIRRGVRRPMRGRGGFCAYRSYRREGRRLAGREAINVSGMHADRCRRDGGSVGWRCGSVGVFMTHCLK